MLALIVGAAHCAPRDLESVAGVEFDVVIAVNRGALLYPGRLDHIISYHQETLGPLREERLRMGLPGKPITHSWRAHPGVDTVWQFAAPDLGSSGLYALKIATRGMGATEVVLAGVPMLEGMGYYDGPESAAYQISRDDYRAWRQFHEDCMAHDGWPRVRSCSGWTAELFGTFQPHEFKARKGA